MEKEGEITNNDGELQHGDTSANSRVAREHAQNDVRSKVDNGVTTRIVSRQTEYCVTDQDALPSCGNLHCSLCPAGHAMNISEMSLL